MNKSFLKKKNESLTSEYKQFNLKKHQNNNKKKKTLTHQSMQVTKHVIEPILSTTPCQHQTTIATATHQGVMFRRVQYVEQNNL